MRKEKEKKKRAHTVAAQLAMLSGGEQEEIHSTLHSTVASSKVVHIVRLGPDAWDNKICLTTRMKT